jgi:hypothetical protein
MVTRGEKEMWEVGREFFPIRTGVMSFMKLGFE